MPGVTCSLDIGKLRRLQRCFQEPEAIEFLREQRLYDLPVDADGFPLGCLSNRTVVYSCGAVARREDALDHDHPPGELALCQDLSAQAAEVMRGVDVGMCSEGADSFTPFFITARPGTGVHGALDEPAVRRAFGGVIYAKASVWVEPLREAGEWWSHVVGFFRGYDEEEQEECLRPWRALVRWFQAQQPFREASFVMIGNDTRDGGCCFPRLALGTTRAGSLAGILGIVVHT